MIYRFDDYSIDAKRFALSKKDKKVSLEPKVFDVLTYLIKNREKVHSKDELIDALWDGRIISDAALNTCIRSVRRALGDDAKQHKYIRTFPKRGFQFVADVTEVPDESIRKIKESVIQKKSTKKQNYALLLVAITFLIIILALSNIWLSFSESSETNTNKTTIAVLNFKSIDHKKQQIYFTEGLIENLVSNLSLYPDLFVIARNSSSLYDNKPINIKKIGEELGAEYIVDGSVQYQNEDMLVSAKLINTKTAQQLWSTKINHKQSKALSTSNDLAYLVIGQIIPAIAKADIEQYRKQPPEDLDAWALYHQARSIQTNLTKDKQENAIQLAEMAIESDPTLAGAYGVIARAKGAQFFYQWTEDVKQTLTEAINYAETAIGLDDNDPGAYAALGYIYRYTGDETKSIANLKRATWLNPSDANIKLEYAHTLDWFRHQRLALPEINLAIKLSPRDPRLQNMYFYKAHILFHLFDYKGSLEATEKMSGAITNKTWRMYYYLMRAANFAQLDDTKQSYENVKEAIKINPKISLSAMRKKFENSKNHPENRRFWLESLTKAGLPD